MEPSKCPICGFRMRDRVKMLSGLVRFDGKPAGYVYGIVEDWNAGCGHIVSWDGGATGTALPNPNVELVFVSDQ